jgi:hypothetical protein
MATVRLRMAARNTWLDLCGRRTDRRYSRHVPLNRAVASARVDTLGDGVHGDYGPPATQSISCAKAYHSAAQRVVSRM